MTEKLQFIVEDRYQSNEKLTRSEKATKNSIDRSVMQKRKQFYQGNRKEYLVIMINIYFQ
jgi:hypothetical protein